MDSIELTHKLCSRCKVLTELNYFRKGKDYCKDCHKNDALQYRIRHPERFKSYNRRSSLKRKFGITEEEYLVMLEDQDYVCAICKLPEKKKNLAVDHDHGTGKIRGLLCEKCNRGLGHFNEDLNIIENALNYLKDAECR